MIGDNDRAMANEIELKLALPESARRALLRHPLLKTASAKRTEQLVNIYYDTPDLALRSRKIALRLRRQGNLWLQTVKCAGTATGGLSTRPEWETPYDGQFDFSPIDDAAVRAVLEKKRIRTRLIPAFETNFRRTTWHFDGVMLMLDRGWMAANGRHAAISELEIELAGGEVDALFRLAETLARRVPLLPAVLSKAERGYRLHSGAEAAPCKSCDIPLARNIAPLRAFRTITLACLEHLQHNHAGAISTDNPEYIHQLRVAARRLGGCLRLFGPLLPNDFTEQLSPPLRNMMALLGRARDLDVLVAEIVAPVLAAYAGDADLVRLASRVDEHRQAARHAAVAYLQSREFGQLMLRSAALLHQAPFIDSTDKTSAADYTAARLQRMRRQVGRLLTLARPDDTASLHALRIGIKRLRYALEFSAPLAKRKTRQRLALRLAAIQGMLGQINDQAGAERQLIDCAGDDQDMHRAIALIIDWQAPHRETMRQQLPELLATIQRLPKVA